MQTSLEEHYSEWNKLAPLGLLLTGMGLSVIGHAVIRKAQGKGWFFNGTLGLILFNAGLAVFGEAIKKRTQYEASLNAFRCDETTPI